MKSWVDKLRQMPDDRLKDAIERQEKEIAIAQRDLDTMKRVLKERAPNARLDEQEGSEE